MQKKSILLSTFLLCIIRVATGQTETYSWDNVRIGGGGFVSGIITSKTEKDLIYCRTDVGGAYRWDVASTSWIPLLDWTSEDEVSYQGVESIAIDPMEPNKVYMLVGTSYFNGGKTAILRSSDYGNSFEVTEVTSQFKAHGNGMGRQTGEKLAVDPNKNSILYCGTRANGLFKSSDSGATWSRVSALDITTTPNENGISFVILDPSTGAADQGTQTILTGISRSGVANIYRSDDGGSTFTAIADAPTSLMPHRAALTKDRKLFVTYADKAGPWDITGAGAIWKYDLETGTWTNITPGGFGGAFGGISVDPQNSDRIVASSLNTWMQQDGGHGDRIFLSTNGGTSWTDVVARGFDIDPNGITWISGNSIHWAGSVEFDPFDTKKAWIISGNGIFQTDDIDATTNVWKFQVKGLEETVALDMVSVSNGPVVSTIGDYGGFRHIDVAEYAPAHSPHMGTTYSIAVASINSKVMLRIGEEKMYYSEDGGITWTECNRAGTKGSVAISADGKVLLYSNESSNTIYRSVDKGITWTNVSGVSMTWARPLGDPVNVQKFYVYNSGTGKILVSNDGGVSFTSGGTAGTGGSKIIRAVPGVEGDIWVPLYGGGLTRSMDAGQTFTKINNVSYCVAIGFGKETKDSVYPTVFLYGTVNGIGGVHRSTDQGATWVRVNDDAHEYGGPGNGQFVNGDMNVFGRVYMSTVGRGIVYGESDQSCLPTHIVPKVTVDSEQPVESSIINVNAGATIKLATDAPTGGAWSWSGPNGFTFSDTEIIIEDIQPGMSGVYKLRYTNASACESGTVVFSVNVSQSVTGVEDNLNVKIDLYPNPSDSSIKIQNAKHIKVVRVRAADGRVTKSIMNRGGESIELSLKDFAAGVYVLEFLDTRNKTIGTRRIVRQP